MIKFLNIEETNKHTLRRRHLASLNKVKRQIPGQNKSDKDAKYGRRR